MKHCYQEWLIVLADTYLSLLRVIAGDTKQFKATLLILQGSSIILNLFMAIFQHQSQPDRKYHSNGNAIKIPRPKVAEADAEELKQIPQHRHYH